MPFPATYIACNASLMQAYEQKYNHAFYLRAFADK